MGGAFVPALPVLHTSFLKSTFHSCAHTSHITLAKPTPNSAAAAAARMSFSSLDTPERATVVRERDLETSEDIVKTAIRQVFGNCYISESEMITALAKPISEFRDGAFDVRELIRAFSKSDLYRGRFFESSGPVRFVELNCKHLLGRGVLGPEEISEHVIRVARDGYEKEIDSYLDSVEYEEMFGNDTVPRFVFRGTWRKNDDFNRTAAVRGAWDGCSTSTRSGSTAPRKKNGIELNLGYGDKVGSYSKIKSGLPETAQAVVRQGPTSFIDEAPKNPNAPTRKRIKIVENLYQVIETPANMPKVEPEWKKELGKAGGKSWNGVWF